MYGHIYPTLFWYYIMGFWIPNSGKAPILNRSFLSGKQISSQERDPDSSNKERLFCVQKMSIIWDCFWVLWGLHSFYTSSETKSINNRYNLLGDQWQQYVWRNACLPCGVCFWKFLPSRGGKVHLWIKISWLQNSWKK